MKFKTITALLVFTVVIVGLVFVAGNFSTLKIFAQSSSSSTPAKNIFLTIGNANLSKQSQQPWVGLTNKTELSTQTINMTNALSVQGGDYFSPVNAQVTPNSNITWINNDYVEHSAVDNGGGAIFNTGNIQPGDSVTVTLRQAGVIPYVCGIHPWMTGQIIALAPGTQPQNASSLTPGYQIQAPSAQPQPPHGSTTGG